MALNYLGRPPRSSSSSASMPVMSDTAAASVPSRSPSTALIAAVWASLARLLEGSARYALPGLSEGLSPPRSRRTPAPSPCSPGAPVDDARQPGRRRPDLQATHRPVRATRGVPRSWLQRKAGPGQSARLTPARRQSRTQFVPGQADRRSASSSAARDCSMASLLWDLDRRRLDGPLDVRHDTPFVRRSSWRRFPPEAPDRSCTESDGRTGL